MSLLGRAEVTPYNAQVELSDVDAQEYPQWLTGNEAVVSLPNSIAVATQGDDRGKVVVEAWSGELEADDSDLSQPMFDGEFSTTRGMANIGNTVGNELHSIVLSLGRHRIRVYTSPAGEPPARVYFLLNHLPA